MPDVCLHLNQTSFFPSRGFFRSPLFKRRRHYRASCVSVFRPAAQLKRGLVGSTTVFNFPPLLLQIEERAIQELLLHYEAHDNPDELIVVERASKGPVAAPTWNKH